MGIRALIGSRFAGIFYDNCQRNGQAVSERDSALINPDLAELRSPSRASPAPTELVLFQTVVNDTKPFGAGWPAKRSIQTLKNSTLLKHLFRPLFNLLLGQILLARSQKP